MTFIYLFVFIISFSILALSSKWMVKSLINLAKFLGWKEFVVAFFTMALAGAIPNLSVGLSAALHKIPQLSFGDIVGGNIIDLTLAVALAVLISGKGLNLSSRTVQGSAVFTLLVAILPLFLIFDGTLSRLDGCFLILAFFVYVFWLFSKKERFTKVYDHIDGKVFKDVFKNLGTLLGAVILLFLAAEGIVRSAVFFSAIFNFPLVLIGILVISLGNALPEIFLAFKRLKKKKMGWLLAI